MSKPSENLRQRKGLLNEEHDDEVFQLRNIFMKSVMYFLPEAIDELEADFEKFQTADSHLDSVMKQIDNWTRKWNIHHDWAIDFVKLVFEQGVTLLELQPGQSSIDLEVSRVTASKYLHTLANAGYLTKRKLGRSVYFVNDALVDLLCTAEGAEYESGPTPT